MQMSNLYMPFCSLLLGLFMIILFFSKVKKFQDTENEYYFLMIVDCFLSTVFCMIAIYLIYCNKSDSIILHQIGLCIYIHFVIIQRNLSMLILLSILLYCY